MGPVGRTLPPKEKLILFEVADKLPCEESELYLSGGTLTVATHFAIKLGARRIVFLGCDAWSGDRDRYHSWDGAPLDAGGLSEHKSHLMRTASAIEIFKSTYPEIEFLDATEGMHHLGLGPVDLADLIESKLPCGDGTMPKKQVQKVSQDQLVPSGYGKMVGVTPFGAKDAVLWFEDMSGTIRAVRMGVDITSGLALETKGQAQIVRA